MFISFNFQILDDAVAAHHVVIVYNRGRNSRDNYVILTEEYKCVFGVSVV